MPHIPGLNRMVANKDHKSMNHTLLELHIDCSKGGAVAERLEPSTEGPGFKADCAQDFRKLSLSVHSTGTGYTGKVIGKRSDTTPRLRRFQC